MVSKRLRCAIYTRKSTEHGLELEFNSLDAQREACAAYIKSQASQSWQCLPQHYDDPAFSGGNLDRPALKQLLKDINAGQIDVVVVYKIDRLTRSLSDFAKLVEIFDAKSVSFVAVTQQFNTTSSMGRLTLNVLLSFAQFERELSSERVRDKIAASRAKGKWTGGTMPLGYDVKNKKLIPHPTEAPTVRYIFGRYLELKSIQKLIDDLATKGIVTKRRDTKVAKYRGGISFGAGSLANLLKNRIYTGQMGHGGKWFTGEHEAIIESTTFEAVQTQMRTNTVDRQKRRRETGALLMGRIFDDQDLLMTPSHSTKKGVRYHFYVSSLEMQRRQRKRGTVSRISAPVVDRLVIDGLRSLLGQMPAEMTDRALIHHHLKRVEVHKNELHLTISNDGRDQPMVIPWQPKTTPIKSAIDGEGPSQPDAKSLQLLVRAHAWIQMLLDGRFASIEALAADANLHPKLVRQAIRLAFIAPEIVAATMRGERTIAIPRKDVPLPWATQSARRDLFS